MKRIILMIIIANAPQAGTVFGYDSEIVHPLINDSALAQSIADNTLKKIFGLPEGIKNDIQGKKIKDWVKDGGTLEDAPICRTRYHFHDPLEEFESAGLSSPVIDTSCLNWSNYSLLVWAQHKDNAWSWQKAREYFYDALTSSDRTTRESKYAESFRALGQVMHLLADSSVPEHVRNDIHLLPFFPQSDKSFPQIGNWTYEAWCRFNADNIDYTVSAVDSSITQISKHPDLEPITNFWDTTVPPGVTTHPEGLAEYTNLNFVSSNTIFRDYQSPMRANMFTLEPVLAEDRITDLKAYFRGMTTDGFAIDHLASTGYLWSELSAISPDDVDDARFVLDDRCFKDFANILVPKAVRYTAGLVNYFFRGAIELSAPDNGVYAITDARGSFKEIRLNAKNVTETGEEMENGTIELVVKYKKSLADPLQCPPVLQPTDFTYVVAPEKFTPSTGSIPKTAKKELVFDLSADPIPAWATDIYLQVVYRGRLGNEEDAVAVGFKDISEPTPVDLVNNMDHVCIDNTYLLAGSDAAVAAVDFDGNGTADRDVFPHGMVNDHLAFSPLERPAYASSATHDALFSEIPPANYGRVLVLADYKFYMSNNVAARTLDERDRWPYYFGTSLYLINGVKSQTQQETVTVMIDGAPVQQLKNVRYCPMLATERGLDSWLFVRYENLPYPATAQCITSNASPPLSGPVAVAIN